MLLDRQDLLFRLIIVGGCVVFLTLLLRVAHY
jgi:hypothetical protein